VSSKLPRPVRRPRLLTPAIVSVAALAVAGAGCGGGDDDVDVGPAAAVPADTPVYLEATVRPEGEAATDANAALGKILDAPDGGEKLISLLEQSSSQDLKPGETFSFTEDVEPWLGERAGIFFTSLEDDSDATVVVESTDTDAALESLREDTGVTGQTGEYGGHTFDVDSDDDTVFGAVGDFIVSGPEEGFQQAVDASEGDSLGDSDTFEDTIADLPDDSLGTLYALPRDFIDALPQEELDAQGRQALEQAAGGALTQPVLGYVTAAAEDIQIELSAGDNGVETEQSTLLEQLPAQAWLGIGFGDLGEGIRMALDNVEGANIPDFDLETIRSQVQLATGLELDQIIDALGNGAIYVEGTSQASLAGALVLQTEDPETTSSLLTRLQSVLQQASGPGQPRVQPLASTTGEVGFQLIDPSGEIPKPVEFVQQDDRVVIGDGPGSVNQVLGGAQPISSVPAFTSAADKLSGLGVDAFLSFAPVFQLAEAEGAQGDPDYVAAKPYIDALDYLAVGSGDEDDRALVRFIIGLK
jgi:hypothetical protein